MASDTLDLIKDQDFRAAVVRGFRTEFKKIRPSRALLLFEARDSGSADQASSMR
jgi:hypothetical protein